VLDGSVYQGLGEQIVLAQHFEDALGHQLALREDLFADHDHHLAVYVRGCHVPPKISIQNDVMRFALQVNDLGRFVLFVEDQVGE